MQEKVEQEIDQNGVKESFSNPHQDLIDRYIHRSYRSIDEIIQIIPEIIVQIERISRMTGSEKREIVIRLLSLILSKSV